MKQILIIIFSIYILSGILLVAYSQPVSNAITGTDILRTDQPYEMYGDKFLSTVVNKTRISKLIGHAKLILKNDKITVTADEIWYYSDEKKLKALRNVIILKEDPVNGNTTATADFAEYLELGKKANLTGSPKIIQEKNEINGDTIRIEFSDTGAIIEIEGNVSGLIYPKPTKPKIEE
ncbi:MAG: hypothetical protein QME64_00460 [bacterium]|nr:hypothetical protein [bacterium]